MDPWPNYINQTTAHYIKHQAEAIGEMLPCLRGVEVHAHLGRACRHDPDMAPIMDGNIPVEGYYMDCGWGYFGFKSSTVTGKYMAQYMATGECPEILKPFR